MPGRNKILSVWATDSYLEDRFDFHEKHNDLIGIPGCGKTTCLNFIQYALKKEPENANEKRDFLGRIKANLRSGVINLEIETSDEIKYTIKRAFGEEPIVLKENGEPIDVEVNDDFFPIQAYSQSELEDIANDPFRRMKIIDSFELPKITKLNLEIKDIQSQLAANANHIAPVSRDIEDNKEKLKKLPVLQEKLKKYQDEKGKSAEEFNIESDKKTTRDLEESTLRSSLEELEKYENQLFNFSVGFMNNVKSLWTENLSESSNRSILEEVYRSLLSANEEVSSKIQEAIKKVKDEKSSITTNMSRLKTAHQKQELDYRSFLTKHKELQKKAQERSELERENNALMACSRILKDREEQYAELMKERDRLKIVLSELRDQRALIRQEIVDHLNKELSSIVELSLDKCGLTLIYKERLEILLANSNTKHTELANAISSEVPINELFNYVVDKSYEKLSDEASISLDRAKKVIDHLADIERLYQLDAIDMPDDVKIKLVHDEVLKESDKISGGQKCCAISSILLNTKYTLIIDQPEDHIGGQNSHKIALEVLKAKNGRENKTFSDGIQLIFVTHSANIPVAGEAERVFVIESNGVRSRIKKSGDVNECKDEIVDILEGGERAFIKRADHYDLS